jgi:hemerythrin-like domain-containing protein
MRVAGPWAMSALERTVEEQGPRDALEHLGRDHRLLERVLRRLESIVEAAEWGNDFSRSELRLVVDFMTLFGDLRHHDKEESLLVPVLVAVEGFDWNDGPLARLRRDHRQERYLLRVLSDIASQEREWSPENVRHLASIGRQFVTFIREHMRFENEAIFEPARSRLSDDVKKRLLAEFERFDEEHAQSTDFETVRRRLEPLL